MFKDLKHATPTELAKIELLPGGDGLDGRALDVSYSASNMIADTFADDDSCRAYSVKANRAQLIRELVAEMGPPNKRALSIIDELMQGEPMIEERDSRTDANRAAYVASVEAKHVRSRKRKSDASKSSGLDEGRADPHHVRADPRSNSRLAVAYVKYRKQIQGAPRLRKERISEDVNVDFDAARGVLGIELISAGKHKRWRAFCERTPPRLPARPFGPLRTGDADGL